MIDHREVEFIDGATILQAARAHDIAIPTLCYHEALEPYAACRLCVVELVIARGSKLVAACAQPCEPGMRVLTNSPMVQTSRRITTELMMASANHLPLIQSLAQSLGVTNARYTTTNDDCILCGLCVRACDELVGAHAISLVERGLKKHVAPPFEVSSAACIGCATCVLICPTGAITFADITPPAETIHDARACRVCGESTSALTFANVAALFKQEVQAL